MNNQISFVRRWRPTLIGVAVVALLVVVFSFPTPQAWAQDFLNIFRVRKFSVLTLDPARLEQLRNTKLNLEGMIGEKPQVLKEAGEPKIVSGPDEAAKATGMKLLMPATVPNGLKLSETRVQAEGSVRFTADTSKLQPLLDALNIKEVKIPAELNGGQVTINKPAMVMVRYSGNGRDAVTFMQAKSPEVILPKGVKIADLAKIGLRLAGMSPQEAEQYAKTIDWNTTLLVPLPANAGSVREVNVGRAKGLFITTGGTGAAAARFGDSPRQQTLLLWADGDMVFAMQGGPGGEDILQMANSLK